MIESAAIFLLLFLAISLETGVGAGGLPVPVTPLVVFYLGGVAGWRLALPLGFFAGIWLDLLYGRELPISAVVMALVGCSAIPWPAGDQARPPPAYCWPGALCGWLAAAIPGAVRLSGAAAGWSALGEWLWQGLLAAGLGAVFLPGLILVLDELAGAFGLPTYCTRSAVGSRLPDRAAPSRKGAAGSGR